MTTKFTFKGWKTTGLRLQRPVLKKWLRGVELESTEKFKSGMLGPHSGRRYGRHTASARGEYPANKSGKLLASLRTETRKDEVVIGTSMFYAKWLRGGSKHMARRKMSDNALTEGGAVAKPLSKGWVAWQHTGRRTRSKPL